MQLSVCWMILLAGSVALIDKVKCDDTDYKDPDYADDDGGLDEDDEENSLPPKIIGQGGNRTFSTGDSISLPCEIQNVVNAIVRWARGPLTNPKPLFFDRSKQINDSRFNLDNQFTLQIKDLHKEDADQYYCQLIGENDTIVYNVEVLSRPKILRLYPEEKVKTLKKGSPLTIMCEAIGEPKPKISWTLKRKHVHAEEAIPGETITINKVSRKNSGEYTCHADNGKGAPDTQVITIIVEYEPEIETNSDIVNSAEGYESELVCIVHAHPNAKVTWYKNDMPLKESHHISHNKVGNGYNLRISATKKTDFGSYKCVANNSMGSSSKVIQLSGLPSNPIFESTTVAEDGKSPLLTWKVHSHSPIQQFELMFKKQQDDKWETAFPAVSNGDQNLYIARHALKNLEAGTYVAQIRARNNYGWSSLSEAKTFSGDVIGEGSAMQSKLLEASIESAACNLEIRLPLVFVMSLFIGYLFS